MRAKLLTEWNWDPSIWIGIALFIGVYLSAVGPFRQRFKKSQPASTAQISLFLAGALVIWFALASPIDEAGDEYLFSAHMIQHILLTVVAPPLLLMGTPGWLLRPLLKNRRVARLGRILTAPVTAYFLFNLTFLAWHVPAFYEATLQNETIHVFEHMSFMITAVITWWPVLSPLPELPRISPSSQILYLFLQGVPATILSALIIFAPGPIYPTYEAAPRLFGMTAYLDQQVAGLVMGMADALVYLGALAAVFFKWQEREEKAGQNLSL
jgi:cytochrome c oxidase assembly factor CtaG